jgi:aminobenzoyl-glutamate transport protein
LCAQSAESTAWDRPDNAIKVSRAPSAEGIRFIFTSVVANFINCGPVGIIVVAMIGIGLAERSGLI